MIKVWTRLLIGLVFVFVTIASTPHARATVMRQPHHPAMAEASVAPGMNADCSRAMMAQAGKDTAPKIKPTKTKSSTTGSGGQMTGGCCANGCNCPLSHCPATPSLLAFDVPAVFQREVSSTFGRSDPALPSYLADTLKRPPRT